MKTTLTQLQGARILSEANDLKRTIESMALELGIELSRMREIIQGNCELQEQHEVIQRMGERYPIDPWELCLAPDDTTFGVKIMRASDSIASARVFDRSDKTGARTPYYEYRDTAMSRMAPFRPEWIRELRLVDDATPNHPDVAYNQGHALHQMTFFIGPVNFYYEINGKRYCQEMQTGDSNYITPFWPHSFTTRDPHTPAIILAVTFGGDVRRAQKEIYGLGDRVGGFVFDSRRPSLATTQLIRQFMADRAITPQRLQALAAERSVDLSVDAILDEGRSKSQRELEGVAKCLDLDLRDLLLSAYDPAQEVVVKRREEGYAYPGGPGSSYWIRPLARTAKMPQALGLEVEILAHTSEALPLLSTTLHSWVFNYGDSVAQLRWKHRDGHSEAALSPGDSAYLQPMVEHGFFSVEGRGRLCVMRVPGALNLAAQHELSYLSQTSRVIESTQWFK